MYVWFQGPCYVPSTVLGIEITKLNLSPFFSPPPISLGLYQFLPFFYLAVGRPPSRYQHALFRVQRKGRGWGPQSDFIELDISLVGIYHVIFLHSDFVSQFTEFILNTPSFSVLACFSPGIMEVTFVFGGVTNDIINVREMGTGGAFSLSVVFKPFYRNPREGIRVTLGHSAHICTCGCVVSRNNTFAICEL